MKTFWKKVNVFDLLLFIVSFIQILMLMINSCIKSDSINLILFNNNYFLIVLIVLTLCIKDIVSHFLAVIFYICFFIFLMGQKFFKEEKNVFLTFSRTVLDTEQFLIFLSIISLGIIISYYAYKISVNKINKNLEITTEIKKNKNIKTLVKFFFWFTLPMALYMQLKIVVIRSSMAYTAGYLINIDFPIMIKVGCYLFSAFALMYLALKPTKKEVFFIISSLLIIEGGMQLLQGRRAFFATTLFFLVWYLIKFYGVKKIKFKYLLCLIIGGFFLILLFFLVEMTRSEIEIEGFNIFFMIKKFMISTGGSDSVIANTIINQDKFPKNELLYLFDPIINNPISILLSGKGGSIQGDLQLQNFNNFAHWISYLTHSELYYTGHGMGSCYLAEVYFAMGLFGVVGVSILLGIIIRKLEILSFNDSLFTIVVSFIFVKSLFVLPRDGLFSFFGTLTYFFIAFCFIYFIYMLLVHKATISK